MSVLAFHGEETNVIFSILVLIFTILSAICSIIVIFLINKMKMTNGHSLLIWTMSWFQLIYDVSFFNAVVVIGVDSIFIIANIAQIIGGISSSLTSNVIAMISFYVVKNTKSVDVLKYYRYILFGVTIPSVVNGVLYGLSCLPGYHQYRDIATLRVYYVIRLLSILFNFFICAATYIQIRKISSKAAGSGRTIPEDAIRTLANRLMYYPIIQALSRSAVAWYEVKYKYDFNPIDTSKNQFIAQCFMAVLTPSASFGYLVVFLLMQPNAWECLKCTLLCRRFQTRPAGSLSTNLINVSRFSPTNAVRVGISSYENNESNPSLHSLWNEDQSLIDDSDSSQVSLRYSFRMDTKEDDELWELITSNNDFDLCNTQRKVTEDAQEYSHVTSALVYKAGFTCTGTTVGNGGRDLHHNSFNALK